MVRRAKERVGLDIPLEQRVSSADLFLQIRLQWNEMVYARAVCMLPALHRMRLWADLRCRIISYRSERSCCYQLSRE